MLTGTTHAGLIPRRAVLQVRPNLYAISSSPTGVPLVKLIAAFNWVSQCNEMGNNGVQFSCISSINQQWQPLSPAARVSKSLRLLEKEDRR